MLSRSIHICFCFIFLFLCTTSLHAQSQDTGTYSFDFRGETLTRVLETVAKETGSDMMYDPEIVRGINIYSRIQNQTVPELLKAVLADTELDFITLSSGTIVIVLTVNENPAYGSYAGKVVDRQTGEPLPGASVMLADASGGTSAGSSGVFTLNKLMTGSYKIVFSYVGYEPVYKTIDIRPNQDVREKVSLNPKPVDFTPIIVTDHLPQMPGSTAGSQSIDPNSQWETKRIHDAIRSLSLFPGVQYGLPMTDLHLQGGQKGEHRILLDGVPVYNPYSFGQMFSAFSSQAISKVRLHKAGFGVSEGSQIAGLVDLQHDVNSITGNRAMIQGDPLSLNLRGDLHIGGDDNSPLKVMTAVRSNYWDIYKEPRLDRTLREWDDLDPLITNLLINSDNDASVYESREHNTDVKFNDIHLASKYEIDPYNTLSSSIYLGENYVSTDLLRQAPEDVSPEYLYARDEYRWNNFMGKISYNKLVSSRLDWNTGISFSSNRFRHRYQLGTNNNPVITGSFPNTGAAFDSFQLAGAANRVPAQRSNNSIEHLILRTDGTYSFTPSFSLKAGLQMDHVESRVDLADLFYLPTLSDQQSSFFSSYLNSNWHIGNYWKFTAGNRLTLAKPAGRFYTEPRAEIQYDRPDSHIGYWSARLSGGLYRQFINQFEITNPGPTSLVPAFTVWSHAGTAKTPKAWHLSGSFHFEPVQNTTLDFEVFHKWQPTTYIVSYENLLQGTAIARSGFNAFAEATDMKTFGAGFRLNQSLADSRLKLMLGYDYSFSRINLESQFGRAVTPPWNEPHRLQLRSLWRAFPELTVVAKWQSTIGRAWAFRQSYYNFLFYESGENFDNYSFANPENDKLSPFHQLDFSLVYKPSFNFMDLEIRMDLINLLNRRNTIDWSLHPQDINEEGTGSRHEIKERTMPGFNPSLSIQMNF